MKFVQMKFVKIASLSLNIYVGLLKGLSGGFNETNTIESKQIKLLRHNLFLKFYLCTLIKRNGVRPYFRHGCEPRSEPWCTCFKQLMVCKVIASAANHLIQIFIFIRIVYKMTQ